MPIMAEKECPECGYDMELVCPKCGYVQDAMDTLKEKENGEF
jgi:rubrerythrin